MDVPTKLSKDILSGLLVIGIGLVPQFYGSYPMGTAARMGPAFLPTALGWLLVALGIALVLHGMFVSREVVSIVRLRPVLFVFAAMGAFTLLIDTAGLVVASLVLIFVGSLGSEEFRMKEVLVLAAVLTSACVLVFVTLLQMPFKVWPV